jgi:4-azaleucine resistance transporter AzlC
MAKARNLFSMSAALDSGEGIAGRALRATIPVMFGYVPIGIAFGFLLTKVGYPWYYGAIMSLLIYSGATQFLAIGLFVNNAAILEIVVTTLFLNLRHSFFGLSLLSRFKGTGTAKPYLIFALTDETYALVTSSGEPKEQERGRYYLFVSMLDHLYWIVGTIAGGLMGGMIAMDLRGLDFALTALFVVLTIEQYLAVRTLRPFIIAAVSGLISLVLVPAPYILLVSIVAGTMVLLLLSRGRR